jgi:hypothetical protein
MRRVFSWDHYDLRAIGFALAVVGAGFVPSLAKAQLVESETRLLQEMLIWTTDYDGLIDGVAGPGTIEAINKFQQQGLGHPPTGQLTAGERAELITRGSAKKAAAGFRDYVDDDAGVSVGIPTRLVSAPVPTKWGKHWHNTKPGLAIDTLRFGTDVSLRQLYDRLLTINNRKIAYQRFVENSWFVVSAFEGEAAVYVRANIVTPTGRPSEIRGFSVWMGEKRPEDYQAIPPAMLSSFKSNVSTTVGGGPTTPMVRPSPIPTTRPTAATLNTDAINTCANGLGFCPGAFSIEPMKPWTACGTPPCR